MGATAGGTEVSYALNGHSAALWTIDHKHANLCQKRKQIPPELKKIKSKLSLYTCQARKHISEKVY